jgi:hypothetical protein
MDYVYRFHSIYPTHSAGHMIYVGGDNDVGGEGEPVTREKIAKFDEFFPHKTINKIRGLSPTMDVDIVSLNVLTQQTPNLTEIPEQPQDQGKNHFRIGVAHIPVLPPFDG